LKPLLRLAGITFLYLACVSSELAASQEAQSLHLKFDSVRFEKQSDKLKTIVQGSASESLKIYLSEVELVSSTQALRKLYSKLETNLGLKEGRNQLLVPLDNSGN